MLSPIPPLVDVSELVEMLSGDPDLELTHDPAEDYLHVGCPVFLQYGEEDTSVPVADSVERIAASLTRIGVPHDLRVYAGLEHLLNVVPWDVPAESREAVMYSFRDFRFGPGVRQDLTDWLLRTTRAAEHEALPQLP
jgi:pimeloyl-ACP methyl ester carboxylesterase